MAGEEGKQNESHADSATPGTLQSQSSSQQPRTLPAKRSVSLPSKPSSLVNRIGYHFSQPLSTAHASWPLQTCYFVSGLLDSVAFSTWGAFFSMMTGNTIFLALALVRVHSKGKRRGDNTGWVRNLVALVAYCCGAFVFPRWHRWADGHGDSYQRKTATSRRIRIGLAGSFLLQTTLIFVAAALVQGHVASDVQDNGNDLQPFLWTNLAPLSLCAFQSAGQFVASRELGYNELPTNVLTSVYSDVLGDPNLFARPGKNVKRERRIVGAVCFFVGGLIGGTMNDHVGMANVLWLAGGIKTVLVCAWSFWSVEISKVHEQDDEKV